METRKVQQLGPSTLAMTLPAAWTSDNDVEKGDELSIQIGEDGRLTVTPERVTPGNREATIRADDLDATSLERAIVAQYVLGRRIIHVEGQEGPLTSDHINAVYQAEDQLMGLGVIEETPDNISIRCSVDPADFTLDNLLERLERTGRTMRNEAIKALVEDDPAIAQRALNRERQANKIFVLLLRLIFTASQDPTLARSVGLESDFPLIGYRSIAKNLELTADNAEDIAKTVIASEGHALHLDQETIDHILEVTEKVDSITEASVKAAVERNFDNTITIREQFHEITEMEGDILNSLPEMDNESLLQIRDVLVALQQTAQFAMRNAEIAANLALDEESEHITIC